MLAAVLVALVPPAAAEAAFVSQAAVTTDDGGSGKALGAGVAVSGDTLAAIPLNRTVNGKPAGVVFVFNKPTGGSWADAKLAAVLSPPASTDGDNLGSVAIDGDTIVAGASGHAVGTARSQGAVFVWVKPPGGWANATPTAELTASDGAENESLGQSVGVSGDTIVAGAPTHKVGTNTRVGAAYVFVKPAAGWADGTQSAELISFDGASEDFFGTGVAISGDKIVVGAYRHKFGMIDPGAAYVFVRPSTGWSGTLTQDSELTATDGGAGDFFGFAVGISAHTVVVGALFHVVGLGQTGAAYVFTEPAFGWGSAQHDTPTAELTASDGATNDRFGATVAVAGSVVVAGAFPIRSGRTARRARATCSTAAARRGSR